MPDMAGNPDVEPADDEDGEPRQAKGKVVDAEVVDADNRLLKESYSSPCFKGVCETTKQPT